MRRSRLLATLLVSSHALAGPLAPPAGPVAPTGLTLGEVEPRINVNALPGNATSKHVITEPGSYYLTDNITTLLPGETLIHIVADDVSLDLNGFTIDGNGVSGAGIFTTGLQVRISNGFVTNTGDGIDMRNSRGGSVTDVHLRDIFDGNGIVLARSSTATDCTVQGCSGVGIATVENSVVERCTAYDCGLSGFNCIGVGTVFIGCAARDITNGAGFAIGAQGVVVRGCLATTCADGFLATAGAEGCSFESCVAQGNSDDGFDIQGFYCQLRGNLASNNLHGFDVSGTGCLVVQNLAASNAQGSFTYGPTVTYGSLWSSNGAITSDNPWLNFQR